MLERTVSPAVAESPNPGTAGTPALEPSAPATGALADPRALQILTTEHWGLLTTRSLTYTDAFSRAGMFLSTLSGAIVALALVAQASTFGEGFIVFGLVILPFVLFIGLTTYVRLGQVSSEELLAVQAMNRLRHGYFEMVPGIDAYFASAGYDDVDSIFKTLTFGAPLDTSSPVRNLLHGFVTTPGMVAVIDSLLAGVIGSMVAFALHQPAGLIVVTGAVVFAVLAVLLAIHGISGFLALRGRLIVRFPSAREDPPA
jgi:hypothetical protein